MNLLIDANPLLKSESAKCVLISNPNRNYTFQGVRTYRISLAEMSEALKVGKTLQVIDSKTRQDVTGQTLEKIARLNERALSKQRQARDS